MMRLIQEEQESNLFDRLPDVLVFTIFNKLEDAKSLYNCMCVCKRFNSITPQVESISLSVPRHPPTNQQKTSFKTLITKLFINPLCFIIQALKPSSRSRSGSSSKDDYHLLSGCSLAQVLKPFKEIQILDIVLPSHGNIEIGSTSSRKMLKWKAEFGRQLQSCVILGAKSFDKMESKATPFDEVNSSQGEEGGEDEDFPFTDDDLKLRIVWTITCLIAASARHYLLSQVLVEHRRVKQVSFSDAGKQGRLCMNDDQVEELRDSFSSACNNNKTGSSSSPSSLLEMRTTVPALRMKMWYAPKLVLPVLGWTMKGATLMVLRPAEAEEGGSCKVKSDAELVMRAFDGDDQEHFRVCNEAMRKLMKSRRNYTLEMNSF